MYLSYCIDFFQISLVEISKMTPFCQRVSNHLTIRRSQVSARVSRPVVSRTLLTPPSEIPYKTPAYIIGSLSKTVLGEIPSLPSVLLSIRYDVITSFGFQEASPTMSLICTTLRKRNSLRFSPLPSHSCHQGEWLTATTLRSSHWHLISS